MDRVLQRLFVNIASNDVVDAQLSEYVRRIGPLVGLDLHFVGSYLLALLAQDANHVEGGASGQPDGDQLNRLGPGVAGRVVDEEVVSAAIAGDKLFLSALRLGEGNA